MSLTKNRKSDSKCRCAVKSESLLPSSTRSASFYTLGLPPVGDDGHPPAFDLAQLRVRHVDLQRQLRHPDVEVQLSGQVEVGEVYCQGLMTPHLLTVYQDLIAILRHLQTCQKKKKRTAWEFTSSFFSWPAVVLDCRTRLFSQSSFLLHL